jgi:hypothetical protein
MARGRGSTKTGLLQVESVGLTAASLNLLLWKTRSMSRLCDPWRRQTGLLTNESCFPTGNLTHPLVSQRKSYGRFGRFLSPEGAKLSTMPVLKHEADAFPAGLFELESPWLVAHVRSRQEKALARYLHSFSVPFYLPQMEKRVRRAGRTVVSFLPLFGGYLFFRGGSDERLRAQRSDLLVNVLEAPDQAALARELEQLHTLQVGPGRLIPHAYIAAGDLVTITEGVFAGYRGVVVREKGQERLVVSVSMIRQSVAVEIDRELLRPDARTTVPQPEMTRRKGEWRTA